MFFTARKQNIHFQQYTTVNGNFDRKKISTNEIFWNMFVSGCPLLQLSANMHIVFQNRTTNNWQEHILVNIEDHMYIHHHQLFSYFISTIFFIPPKASYYTHNTRLVNVPIINIIFSPWWYHCNIWNLFLWNTNLHSEIYKPGNHTNAQH